MEKPFIPTLAQADEVVATALKRNIKLAIAHRTRYNPAGHNRRACSRTARSGAGSRSAPVARRDARGGAEDLWVLGSHVLDLVAYFSGPTLPAAACFSRASGPATARRCARGPGRPRPHRGQRRPRVPRNQHRFPAYSIQFRARRNRAGFGLQIIGTKGLIDFRLDNGRSHISCPAPPRAKRRAHGSRSAPPAPAHPAVADLNQKVPATSPAGTTSSPPCARTAHRSPARRMAGSSSK